MSEAGGGLFYPDSAEEADELPARCADPDCDGDAGHEGQHFQWVMDG